VVVVEGKTRCEGSIEETARVGKSYSSSSLANPRPPYPGGGCEAKNKDGTHLAIWAYRVPR